MLSQRTPFQRRSQRVLLSFYFNNIRQCIFRPLAPLDSSIMNGRRTDVIGNLCRGTRTLCGSFLVHINICNASIIPGKDKGSKQTSGPKAYQCSSLIYVMWIRHWFFFLIQFCNRQHISQWAPARYVSLEWWNDNGMEWLYLSYLHVQGITHIERCIIRENVLELRCKMTYIHLERFMILTFLYWALHYKMHFI